MPFGGRRRVSISNGGWFCIVFVASLFDLYRGLATKLMTTEERSAVTTATINSQSGTTERMRVSLPRMASLLRRAVLLDARCQKRDELA